MSARGSLIIAGSGIASIIHMTLETVFHLKRADVVFYLVNDPVTEAFIKSHNEGALNLIVHYADDRPRFQSYVTMAQQMFDAVQNGKRVLGLFYGHPGVFVHPSYRAIAMARANGFEARMLPGVSAEDYMFAELELDPALFGCMTSEATELVARDRPLDTTVHNIIWQVGMVGVLTYPARVDPKKFALLVKRLKADFGGDHRVFHFIGGLRMTPRPPNEDITQTSVRAALKISDLENEQMARQFGPASSFYIPPTSARPVNVDIAKALGLPEVMTGLLAADPRSGPPFLPDLSLQAPPSEGGNTGNRPSLRATPAMKKLMIDLAIEPEVQEQYLADPRRVAASTADLTDMERFALGLRAEPNQPQPRNDNAIRAVMSRLTDDEPTKEDLNNIAAQGDTTMHITAASVAV